MKKLEELKELVKKGCITHAGCFHADDVFSTALLKICFKDDFKSISRVNVVPEDFDGLVFDIGRGEYDHHQDDVELHESGIKFASFGLLCRDIIPELFGYYVYNKLSQFIEDIDEQDNYGKLSRTDEFNPVSTLIKDFNPIWDDDSSADECFNEAVKFAKTILINKIAKAQSSELAIDLVEQAPTIAGKVLILDRFVPWKDSTSEDIIYCINPSLRGGWSLTTKDSYTNPLPKEWLTDKPEGMIFIHNGLFTCSFETKEQAIKAAETLL